MNPSALSDVRARIKAACTKAGRNAKDVTLIAVSKGHSLDAIQALYQQGQRDFGENYVQELMTKAQAAQSLGLSDIRWHFTGHLQRNKVNTLLRLDTRLVAIHSLDTLALLEALVARTASRPTVLSLFVEVNVDGESSKTGIPLERLKPELTRWSTALDHRNVELSGLMGIPSPKKDPEAAFRALAQSVKSLGPLTQGLLSMGMSADFELAIMKGATHVRVGTALFGPRA